MHLITLHDRAGSGNPLGISGNADKLPFAPYFIFKDLITILMFILALSIFVFFMPNALGDSENYVMANPMQTPPAIVPEWYLLPFYAILRSIPNKLLGVIAMFSAILIILTLPFTDLSRLRGIEFKPLSKIAFYAFTGNFIVLMALGGKHVESPFIEFGQVSTLLYFSYFIVIVPLISSLENSLIELAATNKNSVKSSNIEWEFISLDNTQNNNKYNIMYSAILFVPYNVKNGVVTLLCNKYIYVTAISCFFLAVIYNFVESKIGLHLSSDAPRPWGVYFQDCGTPQMEGLVELHDNILFYLVVILFAVVWVLTSLLNTNTGATIPLRYKSHGTFVELVWTITPSLILILLAFPSFKLLFIMDEVSDPSMIVLAEGHQWYWSYQYPDFLNSDLELIEFDSYLVPESDLEDGALRMLEVDNRLIIPELTHVRFIVTAADVIHSFACPSLGLKCDAYPGRLNQVSIMLNREGTFFGQCSEICGILHSSMPIVFESISVDKFVSWLTLSLLPFGMNNISRKTLYKCFVTSVWLCSIIFIYTYIPIELLEWNADTGLPFPESYALDVNEKMKALNGALVDRIRLMRDIVDAEHFDLKVDEDKATAKWVEVISHMRDIAKSNRCSTEDYNKITKEISEITIEDVSRKR